MFTKSSMDDVRLCPLINIHDNTEQWGVLEHIPTSLVCPADVLPEGFHILVRERYNFSDMVLAVSKALPCREVTIQNGAVYHFDSHRDHEPLNGVWTHFLSHRPCSNASWITCADIISHISGPLFYRKR